MSSSSSFSFSTSSDDSIFSSISSIHQFSLHEIIEATDNFDQKNLLQRDGGWDMYLAKIYYGESKSEKVCASVKRFHSHINNDGLENEVRIATEIQHPNIISLLGYCLDSGARVLVYEHTEKGNLYDYVKKRSTVSLSWKQRLEICAGAAYGLQYLHKAKGDFCEAIIHRDVKPSNILLDENWVAKVSGFDISCIVQANHSVETNLKGTMGYYAPEYVTTQRITNKIDVYGFGVLLFEVLCQKKPWDRDDDSYYPNDNEDLGVWAQENVDIEIAEGITDDSLKAYTHAIGRCLQVDPQKRATMDQVVLLLENAIKSQKGEGEPIRNIDPIDSRKREVTRSASTSSISSESRSLLSSSSCPQFSLAEIKEATNNFESVIGMGGDGMVFIGKIPLNSEKLRTVVAVKRLSRNSTEFEKEILIVGKIRHPNIVSLLGYCSESGEKILVYEYMGKGSLQDYVKRNFCLPWILRLKLCLDVAYGLRHLHEKKDGYQKGIIHRDVKPGSILIDDNWVAKISNFDISSVVHDHSVETVLKGTVGYFAPEYVINNTITTKIDVYGFGMLLFEVLCRQKPWQIREEDSYNPNDNENFGVLAQENVDIEIAEGISDDSLKAYTNAIRRCLQSDPRKRPTMDQVVLLLENALKCQEGEHEPVVTIDPIPPRKTEVTTDSSSSELYIQLSSSSCPQFSLAEIEEAINKLNVVLGEGTEALVYKAKIHLNSEKVGTPVAAKKFKIPSPEFEMEILTVSKFQHPNILSLLGYCNESGKKILMYEYMGNGSLANFVKKGDAPCLTWKQRLNICLGVAYGLQHLHKQTDRNEVIVHRDVKPANILLDDNLVAKVSDFGMLKLLNLSEANSFYAASNFKGTFGYSAPEYLQRGHISTKIDVYSFGIVMYEVLCRRRRYDPDVSNYNVEEENENIGVLAKKNIDKQIKDYISYNSLDIFTEAMGGCLRRDPKKRLTMDKVVQLLEAALMYQEGEGPAEGEQILNNQFMDVRVSKYDVLEPESPFSTDNGLKKVPLDRELRAEYFESMLTELKIPLPDFHAAILTWDVSKLKTDDVENVIRSCPTEDEMEKLKNYNGDKEALENCEQFFLELAKVPRLESKLGAFCFSRASFSDQVKELQQSLETVNLATIEVKGSIKLRQVMQIIVTLWNSQNQGTASGFDSKFGLGSLLKLSKIRSKNRKMTMIRFLCKHLAEKKPELLDFDKDLVHLEAAAELQIQSMAEEIQAIRVGLQKVEQEVAASDGDGVISASFQKVMRTFLGTAEAEFNSLRSLYFEMRANLPTFVQYFGEDLTQYAFEQVATTLLKFTRMFITERQLMADLENKKLEQSPAPEDKGANREIKYSVKEMIRRKEDFTKSASSSSSSGLYILQLSSSCPQFSLAEIKEATNNFKVVLGKGGEGKVYKAEIHLNSKIAKTPVAVKQLHKNSSEFEKEILTITKIRHPNVVSLLGYCNESDEKILVYEYMGNGSLAAYVKKDDAFCLTWKQRLNICLSAAYGLQHLHKKTDQCQKGMIHRDVKPANILLDNNWVAKVADFGMLTLSSSSETNSSVTASNFNGTAGYFAPEYVFHRRLSTKIDVYSFGLVMFEVLCRRKRWDLDEESNYNYVEGKENIGVLAQQNVDKQIKDDISFYSLKIFTDTIRDCLQKDPNKRLTMDGVVRLLESALTFQEREDEQILNIDLKALRFSESDMFELESPFSTGNELKEAQLDHELRAEYFESMLTVIDIPLPDFLTAIFSWDASTLKIDDVENVLRLCPTEDELERLKNYNGDKEMLGKCDQFFLELAKIPRLESKLGVFCFSMTLSHQVNDLRQSMETVNVATIEVKRSRKLRQVIQIILTLWNSLNQGTAPGAAFANAQHCHLADKKPELLDFDKDLVHLEAAADVNLQIQSLAEEIQAFRDGLQKVEHEVTASDNDGFISDIFQKVMRSFLHTAEAEVNSISSFYSEVRGNLDTLVQYLGEDPAQYPFEQVATTLLKFTRMFITENQLMADLENKKL